MPSVASVRESDTRPLLAGGAVSVRSVFRAQRSRTVVAQTWSPGWHTDTAADLAERLGTEDNDQPRSKSEATA